MTAIRLEERIAGVGWSTRAGEKVIEQSRRWYATRRDVVEARLKRWGARPEMPRNPNERARRVRQWW